MTSLAPLSMRKVSIIVVREATSKSDQYLEKPEVKLWSVSRLKQSTS